MKLHLFLTLLTQLVIMSSAANDEDPWVESIEESQQHQSQTGEAILDENNVSVRRSTRSASKSSCPSGISDWPLPKILEVLFKSHIPLFQPELLMRNCLPCFVKVLMSQLPSLHLLLKSPARKICRKGKTSSRLPLRPLVHPNGHVVFPAQPDQATPRFKTMIQCCQHC